jgi:16S rRNA (cytosine967-C5)-methyltransferase
MPAPIPNPRAIAWRILGNWSPDGTFAEDLIEKAAQRHGLSGPNRSLVFALVMAVLRHRSLLDAWIDALRGDGKTDPETRNWLRLGLAQLAIMGLPPHAAVHETVQLAGRAKGLVNAILRRATREPESLAAIKASAPPWIRHSLPEFLVRSWLARWSPPEVEALGSWCNLPAPVFVRANGLVPNATTTIASLPEAEALPAFPGWFRVPEPPLRELQNGTCYAQDPSTGMAPLLLRPHKDHAVLDACAAPGGKTAILAELMNNQGQLIATDNSASRLARLSENLQRLRAHAECLLHDWEHRDTPASLSSRFPEGFDRILLDTPCSNTGVIRRRADVRWRLTPEYFTIARRTQSAMLARLLQLLKPGGRLVYSTCSIEPEENTGLVREVLATSQGFRKLEEHSLLPHRDATDGAYAALIERIPPAA